MLRYMYRLALPGGRRVIIAYLPAKTDVPPSTQPQKTPLPQHFDRAFAQAGLHFAHAPFEPSRRGKRTR